jgi:hypothetical protein
MIGDENILLTSEILMLIKSCFYSNDSNTIAIDVTVLGVVNTVNPLFKIISAMSSLGGLRVNEAVN